MVTKGIITEIINKYQARVRIPIYNKAEESPTATPNNELSIGPVCTLSGISPNISVGDVVIVAFEQDVFTEPIILGLLYMEDSSKGFSDIKEYNILQIRYLQDVLKPFHPYASIQPGHQEYEGRDTPRYWISPDRHGCL